MGADEEGTLARLAAHRRELIDPKFSEHNGRIVKLMGDGVLVEFASVVDAVRCAAEIQRGMAERNEGEAEERRIVLRIGINLGDIIVEGDDIHGDGVNVAARLEAMAEPGGICISRSARDQVRDRLPYALEDLGEHEVKNIARPVRVFRVVLEPSEAGEPAARKDAEKPPGKRRRWAIPAAAAAIVIAVVAGVLFALEPWVPQVEPADPTKMAYALPEKPSIAVLPFDNLTGDPEQDYLGDGLTENIIAVLSNSPGLFVIARNSVFTFKGKPTLVNEVAEQLGVRYVLEGSVQRDGNRLRVTAQLVDAIDGRHLWAERYDRELDVESLFAVQDEITKRILVEIHVELLEGEGARRRWKSVRDLDTFRLLWDAGQHWERQTPEGNREAERLYLEALKRLPDNEYTIGTLGSVYWQKVYLGISENPAQDWARARDYAEKALAINDEYAQGLNLMGALDLGEGRHDSAIARAERVLQIAPNDGYHVAIAGWIKSIAGQPGEAEPIMMRGMRLDPIHPAWLPLYLALNHMALGRLAEAKAVYEGVWASRADHPLVQLHAPPGQAVISVLEGDVAGARKRIEAWSDNNPVANIATFKSQFLNMFKDQAFVDRYLTALRQAGLPENPPPPLPDKPSIAVLPFTNLSADADQDYFVDGMTDTLITDLSNIPELFVIARNTSFTYKGQAVDVKRVGRELGVRYVLEGSVQRASGRVRINAQLIDATTGGHVWSERFDRANEDIFALQDEAVGKIIAALPIVPSGTVAKPAPTASLDAYDFYLRGRQALRGQNVRDFERAIGFFERAIELDPNFALAYSGLAKSYSDRASSQLFSSGEAQVGATLVTAFEHVKAALRLEPRLAEPYITAASLMLGMPWREDRHDAALEWAEKAVAREPDNPDILAEYARLLNFTRNSNEALGVLDEAGRRNPKPPAKYALIRAWILFHLGDYESALAAAETFRAAAPDSDLASEVLAPAHAYLGNREEAEAHLAIILKHDPTRNLYWYQEWHGSRSLRERGRLVEGYRLAGLPITEGGAEPKGERLSGDEIAVLLGGRTITGRDLASGVRWWQAQETNGSARRWDDAGDEVAGSFTIEDGWACWEWDAADDFKRCDRVYRTEEGATPEAGKYLRAGTGCICAFEIAPPPPPLPEKPSIAVLPFTNISADSDQEYFVDGMTDTLITDLSNIPELFVIARNTSFTYKGQAVDVKRVGRELGVRYVLEGSVQRAGGRVRINAQLIDATTGGHVWSERFDRANADIFALQDEAIAKIIAALPIVPADQTERPVPSRSLEAYDLYLRGMETIHKYNLADLERSITFFEKALAIDPGFALAHAAHVRARVEVVKWQLSGEFDNLQKGTPSDLAWQAILTAQELDPDDAIVKALQARMRSYDYSRHDRFDQALKVIREAVSLAPDDPEILMTYASLLSSSGAHTRALEVLDEAYRLDPKPPARYSLEKATILFHLGRYGEAVENAALYQTEVPTSHFASWILAPALAFLGNVTEANAELAILTKHRPELTLQLLAGFRLIPMKSERDQRHFLDGFRLAGLPVLEQEADFRGQLLAPEEVGNLLSNQTIAGEDFASGLRWWYRQDVGGGARRWDNDENESHGTFAVEDGWACWAWDAAEDYKRCSRVYRNPTGAPGSLEQYLLVGTGCGPAGALISTNMVSNTRFLCRFGIEQPPPPLPEKPSIAVLPFTNLSADPDQEYFVDGMTETLITDLAKVTDLFVIARNTSFTYKGRAVDIKQVGRELGVRYIVEGSVQRAGGRVRINAQLIEAAEGGHVWAERFDGAAADVFALQDQVAGLIVRALALKLTPQEAARIGRAETDNLAAHDAYLLGLSHYNRQTLEGIVEAVAHLKNAVELDPDYAAAYTALAKVYAWKSSDGIQAADALKIPFRHMPSVYWGYLEKGMARPSADNHLIRSWIARRFRQYDRAIAEAEQALALNPNHDETFVALAEALIYAGRPNEGIPFARQAMRLNPTLPAYPLFVLGLAEFTFGNSEKSVELLHRARQHAPDISHYAGLLAAAYGELGMVEEAKTAFADFAKGYYIPPALDWSVLMYPFAQESVLDRLAAGFRAAGVPSEEDGGIDHLPLHDGNKLSGAEIKSLLFDREIGGYDFWEGGSSWTQRRTAGGAVEHDGFPSHVGITGVTAGVGRIEDDMLCELWPEYNKTQEICVVIYRIPGGKFQWDPFKGATTLDYVMVTELGPHPFSPVE